MVLRDRLSREVGSGDASDEDRFHSFPRAAAQNSAKQS